MTRAWWFAPDVVLQWLRTGDESIRSAAYSAADSAAREKQNARLHRMLMQAIREG